VNGGASSGERCQSYLAAHQQTGVRPGRIGRIASPFRIRRTAALYAGAGFSITLLHAALSARTVGHFSPDSWNYYELSQSVLSHFYRVTTIRQFSFDTPYGVSFPPLLPVLEAMWNAIANSGVYAGTCIDLIAAALTFPLLIALGRRLAASDAPAIFAAAALYGNPWYLDEVMGGRAIPIAILLFTLLLLLLHDALRTNRRPELSAALAGLVAGLIFEARFDFLLPAMAIGAALGLGRTRAGSRLTAAYTAGLVVAVAPWIAYSMIRVGVPLAADNVRTLLAVAPVPVLRFVPFPDTIATLRNAPFEWLASKIDHSGPTIEALAIAVGASAIPALAAMWAATRRGAQGLPRETAIVLVLAWIALVVQFDVTATTGYPDVRFWIAVSTFGTFTVAAALCYGSEIPHLSSAMFLLIVPSQLALLAAAGHQPDRVAGIFSCLWPLVIVAFVTLEGPLRASRALARLGKAAAIAVPLAALGAGSVLAARWTGSGYRVSADATARTRSANVRIVEGLDGADPSSARILLADVPGAPIPCEFGARTGVANVLEPSPPFGWVDLWLLVRRYGITHAVAGDPDLDARLPILFAIHKSANGALWKIDGERPGLIVIDETTHPAGSVLGLDTMKLVTNDRGPIDALNAPSRRPDDWPYPLLLVPRN
jgi:hypothetical protein